MTRTIDPQAPSTFRLHVAVSEADMAVLRRSFRPGESATQAIRRLALERAQEIGHKQRQMLIARAEDTLARVDRLLADDAQEVGG